MYAYDVDETNFEKIVLEGSKHVPIVVDFWAPWCGPCQVLKPLLEKLAEEYAGKFVLAKINSDENQKLAGEYGVRGIPNVKAFYNGVMVNEFSGALPENELRKFIDEIIPSPAQELRFKAGELYRNGDLDGALQTLNEALALNEPGDAIIIDKANILVELKNFSEAKTLLSELPVNVKTEEVVVELLTQIDLAEKSQNLPEEDTLLARIENNTNDLQAKLDIANLYIGKEQYESAFEQLLAIVKQDRGFQDDVGRKTILSLFTVLGNQHDLVKLYRRQLASLLN